MEKTYPSASVSKCSSEMQHMLKVNDKEGCSDIVTRKESEVMVERVSSTTEPGTLTINKNLLDTVKSVLHAKVMSEEYRNKEKCAHSRTPDRSVSKSKSSKSSHQSRFGDKDKAYNTQLPTWRKDMESRPHSSVEKRFPRKDKQAESEVPSSSLVLARPVRSFSSKTQITSGSSVDGGRNFSYSNSEPVTKSNYGNYKYPQPHSRDLKHASSAAENHNQNTRKQIYSKHHQKSFKKEGTRKEYGNSSEHNKDRESSIYNEMVERKVREIRNNLEKMSSKVSRSLVGSVSEDAVSKSRQRKERESDERYEEEDSQLVPFLPSSRCCSPPPRPTNITKYWSDAEETEDDSDIETHFMHVNSVNIVLNFLKRNSNRYYKDAREVKKQNETAKTMQTETESQSNIRERLFSLADPVSRHSWSYSRDTREQPRADIGRDMSTVLTDQDHAGFTMRANQSPARERCGHSSRSRSPVFADRRRDRQSRSPIRHKERYDKKRSIHSSDHRRHHYSRSRSPPGYRESSSRNRDSSSTTRHRERSRSSRRDIESGYSPRRRVRHHRESCSPLRYRKDSHCNRESPSHVQNRGSLHPYYNEGLSGDRGSPSHMQEAEDSLRNRGLPFLFDKESPYRSLKSPPSSLRSHQRSPELQEEEPHDTEANHHSMNTHLPSLNPQEESKGSYEDCGLFGPSKVRHTHADSRVSFGRHAHGHESPRSESPRKSAEPYDSLIKQESGLGRPMLSNKQNVLLREQVNRHENENKLPLAFGKGLKKVWNSSEIVRWERSSSVGSRKWQKEKNNFLGNSDENQKMTGSETGKEFEKGSTLNIISDKDNDSSTLVTQEDMTALETDVITVEDDEPIIDRPEDYLTASSTVPTNHRPSFVPDVCDREKLSRLAETSELSQSLEDLSVSSRLAETSELSQSLEDLSVSGPSGITNVVSPEGKERDNSLIVSKNDLEMKYKDSTMPQISSPSTSPDAVSSEEPTLAASSDLSSVITTEVAKMNSAEMSTLLTLIKLAKELVATGKALPTNLSQVLGTSEDTKNSKISQPLEEHSGKNQQQQPTPRSAGIRDKGVSDMITNATTPMSVGIQDKGVSDKYTDATTPKIAGIQDKAVSDKNTNATTPMSASIKDKGVSDKNTNATTPKIAGIQDKAVSDKNTNTTTPKIAGIQDRVESEKNIKAATSKSAGIQDKVESDKNTNATMPKSAVSEKNTKTVTKSVGVQDKAESEKNTKTVTKSAGLQDKAESEKNTKTVTKSAGLQDKAESEKNAKVATPKSDGVQDKAESKKDTKTTTKSAGIQGKAESKKDTKTTTKSAGIQGKAESKKNTKALIPKSAGTPDKAEYKKDTKATTPMSNTKNSNTGDEQNVKEGESVINKKNGKIPKDKKDEIVLQRKTDSNFSKLITINKHSQSKNISQGSKTDDELSLSKKSHKQLSGKNVDQPMPEGKCNEMEQLSNNGGDEKEEPSKKKIIHKDEARRQLKSNTKGTVVERTFTQMQSVRVNLSASPEAVAASRTMCLTKPKKQLKQVGKRILIKDSFNSDGDNSFSPTAKMKNESLEAGHQPHDVHPLHQETIVLDHSVNLCPSCRHSLHLDEFTRIFLNTGTITMRCRNCLTYTRMEKVVSLDYFTALSMPKSDAPKAPCSVLQRSETFRPPVDNKTLSSKQGQNKETSKRGESCNSNKQPERENKHFSQEINNVKDGKAEISAYEKIKKKKLGLADAGNASKPVSVFKEDKCQRNGKDSKSSSNKTIDSEENEKEKNLLNELDSFDPQLFVFPWTSSRKKKKLIEDDCNKDQQCEKPQKKRRKIMLPMKRKLGEDKITTHPSKPAKAVKPISTARVNIATKSSDAVKISNSKTTEPVKASGLQDSGQSQTQKIEGESKATLQGDLAA